MHLDATDRKILNALQQDGRLSNVNLAEKVNLSESACLRRVKTLEAENVIKRYTMVVNEKAVGVMGSVFVEISLESQRQQHLDHFEQAVQNIPEVMECYLMSGDYDYLLRIVIRDIQDYERIHHDCLTNLPNVARVRSAFSLRPVTHNNPLWL